MGKVRLDFYLGFGVKPIEGDGIWCSSNGEVIVTGAIWYLVNSGGFDWRGVYISNFTERENKGVQPVPDGFPVVVTFKGGRIPGCKSSLAKDVDWENSHWYARWKPDYEKLLEMQKEHDAKQEKPIEELMINAKESKMSKNNKHPHHDLIAEWAKDTSKEVQVKNLLADGFSPSTIQAVVSDEGREYEFCFKPREFQKGHWYPCIYSYGDIEVNMWNGEGFVSITNAIICSQPSEFMQIGESLGEIKFGDEE